MIRVNPSTINDLLALSAAGAPVSLTSHPGNASLYKLSLWRCGIPEYFWDVTCCVADANNWPMFRLRNGEAELLVSDELHQKIKREAGPGHRFVTAYQRTKDGGRLGRVHVRACERAFPEVISSCSRLILSEVEKVREVFGYLAETRPNEVFSRFITPEGLMVPIQESGLRSNELVDSFVQVLQELDHLLFSDEAIETRGGACYHGPMVPLAGMLVQYWQTGRMDRYDVSGPDMIHYATKKEHQESLSEMLRHLHKWNPKLVPPSFMVRMFPGTGARVGYIPGHVSEEVMDRKVHVLWRQGQMQNDEKKGLREKAKEDEGHWPAQIKPNQEHYFSQHDLAALGRSFEVDDFWKDIPLESMQETLHRANAILKLK